MKPAYALSCLLLAACNGPGDPADALDAFFDAAKEGKGELAVSYLSGEAIDSLGAGLNLAEMRGNPERASSMLASYGIAISEAELDTITTGPLLERLVESPLFEGLMEDALLETEGVSIEGRRAIVNATVVFLGDTTTGAVEMVLENNQWKIGSEGLRFALL